MTSFLLECLHFLTPAHVNCTFKGVIVLQGLISVGADIRLQLIIEAKKMCGTRAGCLSRLLEVLNRTVDWFE